MFDFLKTLFNPAPPSSSTAKERLRLVLLSDHLSLSPETVQALKADLLAVISKYVEIDPRHADVTFEHRENEVAMLANIPITGVRERKRAIEENVAPPVVPNPAAAAASPAAVAVPTPVDLTATPTRQADRSASLASETGVAAAATDDIEEEIARNNAAAWAIHEDAQPTLDLRAEPVTTASATSSHDVAAERSDDAGREAAASTNATHAVPATPDSAVTAAATPAIDEAKQRAPGNHASRRRRRKKNANAAQRPPAPQSFGKPAQA